MAEQPIRPQRRSIRLATWDYRRAAAYFVTICAYERIALFGIVRSGRMMLSPYGEIASREWFTSADIRAEIKLDAFVVMPDHVHGIVWITRERDTLRSASQAP